MKRRQSPALRNCGDPRLELVLFGVESESDQGSDMAEENQSAYGEPEEGMKMKRKWTIALRPAVGLGPRKITKIIGLNGDGFSVLTPYHKSRSGYLNKTPIDPNIQGKYRVP